MHVSCSLLIALCRPSLVPLAGLKGKALCGIAASRRVKDVDWEVFV